MFAVSGIFTFVFISAAFPHHLFGGRNAVVDAFVDACGGGNTTCIFDA